ncbi:unnamed protein product, partial [Staurois parvus]
YYHPRGFHSERYNKTFHCTNIHAVYKSQLPIIVIFYLMMVRDGVTFLCGIPGIQRQRGQSLWWVSCSWMTPPWCPALTPPFPHPHPPPLLSLL